MMISGLVFAEGTWTLTDQGCKVWNPNPRPNEAITWSGGMDANSYATGQGVLQWFNDGKLIFKYEGNMLNGKETGKGIGVWANGDRYEGDFIDDHRTGKGIYAYGPTSKWAGDRYEGDYVGDKMTGKGIYSWAKGGRYEGEFIDGHRTGKGIYTWSNGDRYEGDFIDGHRTRKATQTWANGNHYDGDFVNDQISGYGTYYNRDGSIWRKGRWSNDQYIGP